jgi:CP family cyanate transporter-like MFS transporter
MYPFASYHLIRTASSLPHRSKRVPELEDHVAGRSLRPRPVVLAAAAVVLAGFNLRTAVAQVPPVLPDLELSRAAQSLVATLPVVCFGFVALGTVAILRRLGEERGVLAALALLTAGIAVRGVWPDVGLIPGTVATGCAIAVVNVLLPGVVRRRFHDRAGAMTAAYTIALTLGATLAASLMVPIATADGGSLALAFGVWALPAALALAVWVPLAARPLARHARVARGEPRALLRSPLAWSVTLFFGAQSLVFYALLSWLPLVYRGRGVDASSAGALVGLLNLVEMAGSLLVLVIVARTRDQRPAVVASVVLILLGLVGVLAGSAGGAVVSVVLLGLGGGASLSLALLLIVVRASDDDGAVRLSAMAQGVGYLIGALGPLAFGMLHEVTGTWGVPLGLLVAVTGVQLVMGLHAGRLRVVHDL